MVTVQALTYIRLSYKKLDKLILIFSDRIDRINRIFNGKPLILEFFACKKKSCLSCPKRFTK